jgi:aerobic-type carbon monoxide dehydrogenase small subunit (CoxS/CutS family)
LKISFSLNGKGIVVDAPPDRRVLDLLREDIGLLGTKEGCGQGDCGACAVLVDGVGKLSCLMLAAQLEGREITTIEGVSEEGDLHLVQKAFIEKGAVQCGFCTPGMVIAALDCLNRNPEPSRLEIRESISGNLCRCTGYQKIVDAIEAACSVEPASVPAEIPACADKLRDSRND